jgi:nucleotide-binding universal stress UspA family protein
MYTSILVPLDGSSFAQQALLLALSVARRARARLELVQVHASYGFEVADLDIQREQQEESYLDATAKWAASVAPVSVAVHVLPGQAVVAETVADRILERGHAIGADLIVCATRMHGLPRIEPGGVAVELIRRAAIPVLLVQESKECPPITEEPVLDNILICLDGSSLAEHVLGPALDLARLIDAHIVLLRIVDSRPSLFDRASRGTSTTMEGEAYMELITRKLREHGLQLQTRVVAARRHSEAILEEAMLQGSNLIALTTHGQSGLKRLLLGSVADQLIRSATSPVLVCCPTGKEI